VQSIFHPSDFSRASEVAFAHALKFALIAKADLNVLHVSKDWARSKWEDFPGVRGTLERWGILPPGSDKSAVVDLGIGVRKVMAAHDDPVRSATNFLEEHATDLIVLSTNQHEGGTRWLRKRVAEPLARQSKVMTLFVPHGVDGFVSIQDGSLSLTNFVIPVDSEPNPQAAVDQAARAAERLGVTEADFVLVHVGDEGNMPALRLPERDGWRWKRHVRQGDVVEAILAAAKDAAADVIIMATAGHNGFLDALRGSTTERVLRGARCPLLAIPA